jgi:Carboxypeptidase regulatory-like domain
MDSYHHLYNLSSVRQVRTLGPPDIDVGGSHVLALPCQYACRSAPAHRRSLSSPGVHGNHRRSGTDASGAVVPNAGVTAVQQETRDTRQTRANDRGEYNIPYVRTGTYNLSAEAPGFKTATQTGVVVQVDQTVNLQFKLQIGAVSEQVEVSSSAPLVDSATSSLGQVINNKKIVDLPLNGRNTFALGLLSGNTIPVSGMATNLPFVAGGGRYNMNDVMMDGIDDNTSVNAGSVGRNGIAYTPSVDAVEEFKVKTSSFSAEFGRSAGAIISATTKSGTNQLHGNAWEFLRNNVLDANNFFSNAGGIARQAFRQNQFGFTLGGPVVLPKVYHGRDKTFFFGDYEGTRRRTSASSTILDIPPAAFRAGDFSSYAQTIYDPRTRTIGPAGTVISTPFGNNTIPQSLLNPSSVATLGLLPAPNFGAPNAQSRNYIRIAPQPYDNDQFDTRIDHRLPMPTVYSAASRWPIPPVRIPATSTDSSAAAPTSSATRATRSSTKPTSSLPIW